MDTHKPNKKMIQISNCIRCVKLNVLLSVHIKTSVNIKMIKPIRIIFNRYKYIYTFYYMINVEYVPRILKGRDRLVCKTFMERLSNPFVLFVWFYVAFQIEGYDLIVLFVFSGIGSVWHVYHSYSKFVFDILYMEKTVIPCAYKITLWSRDFFIQYLCCILSFWWSIRPLDVDRIHEGYVWIISLLLCFLLHVIHSKQSQNMSEQIIKQVYNHVVDV